MITKTKHSKSLQNLLFQSTANETDLPSHFFDAISNVKTPNSFFDLEWNDSYLDFVRLELDNRFGIYKGSMTMPTCQRTVQWLVAETVLNVNAMQVWNFLLFLGYISHTELVHLQYMKQQINGFYDSENLLCVSN